VSAALVGLIRAPEPAPERADPGQTGLRRDVAEGARFVAQQPILRAFAINSLASNFFGNFYAALYALYCIRDLGMSPALLGLSVAAGGLGDLVGAVVAERVTTRFGIGAVLRTILLVSYPLSLLVPLAGGPLGIAAGMVIGAQLFGDGLGAIFQINELSVRQSLASDALMGRVNGAMYLLSEGVGPLGAVVGGALAEHIGARDALLISAIGGGVGHLFVIFSPVRRLGKSIIHAPSAVWTS
jgi:predicted MFS family arabinose efflux permease